MSMYMLSTRMTAEDLTTILIAILVIGVICTVALVVIKNREVEANARLPIRKELAMVVEKEQLPLDTVIVIDNPWVTFELRNGSHVRVRSSRHGELITGDIGMLSWQGDRMISFTRNVGNRQPVPIRQAPENMRQRNSEHAPSHQRNPASPEARITANTETVFCSKCGRKQRKSNAVCWDCGAEIKR